MAVEFSEKRRFKRVPLVFPVKGKWMEKLFHSHIFQGKTLDVSNEGLCIKVDNSKVFKVGQEVKLKTWLYGDDFLEARGRVCWVHGLPDPDWPINMGVKIIRMRNDALWIERVQNKITEEAILGKDRGRSSGKKTVQAYPTDSPRESLLAADSPKSDTRNLELLLKVSNIFAQSLNIDELLGEVIDQILDVLKRIDRGAILLLNKETGKLREVVSKTRMEDKDGIFSKINYSRTIVKRTIRQGEPVLVSDTNRMDEARLSNSMQQMNIRSVMCVPLKYKGEVRGAIYVDSIGLPGGFRKDDLQSLAGLGNTAAIAIENARLYSDLEKLVERRTKQLRKAQENQQQLQKQLSHAQKMESLGRLAGGVAHNFRNILQAILGNAQFLQMVYSQDGQLQKIARAINESVAKGSDFIYSLLRFSRQEVEKENLPLDLKSVLDETYKIISNTFDKSIKIATKIEKPLPIKGDRLSLGQVFINLCNNARDSMPDGGELRIEAKKDKKAVVVTISDTGCGMDEETLKNIFDPFFTTKDVGEGTGLGLSITHGIIKENKGKISVSSQPGKGTIFRVAFPVAEKYEQIEPEAPQRIRHGKGEKILIVDDEPAVLEGLENMIKSIGYKVDSVSSGSQAIEHYKTHKPDVVLLDWKMPHMDGATCAKKILENDPAARIVIISGYQETAINKIDAGLKKTLKGLILKPCKLENLNKAILEALNSKR
ncbi:MAG: response regulator [Deltaproteobacteria bacterium]|nr:response regulator [Deltaproteobacteria bacterium]